MLRPVGSDAYFYAYFSSAHSGATGLSDVTINIDRMPSTIVKTGEEMTEYSASRHPGWYLYKLVGADATSAGDYIATASTADASVDSLNVPCLVILSGKVPVSESLPLTPIGNSLLDLLRQLRIRLNDLTSDGDPGGNYSTEALTFFINLAYRETVRRAKCLYTTLTIATTDNTEEYDCSTLFEVVHVIKAATAGAEPLKRTTMRDLLIADPDYRNTAKSTTQTHWYVTKGGYIGLYPKTSGTSASYLVSGYAYPTALTASADLPDALPDGDAVQVLLDRAECHARRARPTHANNVMLAQMLEQSWGAWCQDIAESLRGEGN